MNSVKENVVSPDPTQILQWIRWAWSVDDNDPLTKPLTAYKTVPERVEHLKLVQHTYLRHELEVLGHLIIAVRARLKDGYLKDLVDGAMTLKCELEEAMTRAEQSLFPLLSKTGESNDDHQAVNDLCRAAADMTAIRSRIADSFRVLRALSCNYLVPSNSPPELSLLMYRLGALDVDVARHFSDESSVVEEAIRSVSISLEQIDPSVAPPG